MANEHHVLVATYSPSGYSRARPEGAPGIGPYQYDYGHVMRLDGFPDLPLVFEIHFGTGGGSSVTAIGNNGEVSIPDECFLRHGTLTAWLFLHDTETDGETRYVIAIIVKPRAAITHDEPTPVQQSEIEQLIAALNLAVDQSESNVTHYPIVQDGEWMVWSAAQEAYIPSGVNATGDTGNGIAGIVFNNDYTLTITMTDGTAYTTQPIRGERGEQGIQGEKGDKGDPGEESVMVATLVSGNRYRLELGRE